MKNPLKCPQSETFSRQSGKWTQHFKDNRNHMSHVPWELNEPISDSQHKAIAQSIAVFQLGENSEGNSFLRAGKAYAQRTGDFEYLAALELFIKEEQNHSATLGRFMEQQNIPTIKKEWTDSTFRFLRKIAGLNVCITVLITAEIIAAVYYRALGQSTNSKVLRAICGQILIDEAHHLQFQASTLAKERLSWHPLKRWAFVQLHRIVLAGTILVVWKEHRSVYRAGNFSFFQWVSMTWAVLEDVLLTIQTGMTLGEGGEYGLPIPSQTPTTRFPGLPSLADGQHRSPLGLNRAATHSSFIPLKDARGLQEVVGLLE